MNETKIKETRDKVIEALRTYFTEDAIELIGKIEELRRDSEIEKDENLSQELDVYLALMKFIAFATISQEEQLELFKKFLVKAFRIGIDIKSRFAIKMNMTSDIFWPETSQMFFEAILNNTEKIGTDKILIKGENEEVDPLLSNWLRDYNRIYGMDRHEKIIPNRYLNESSNVRRLNGEERILLLKILEFYESIKFPSQQQIEESVEKAYDEFELENPDYQDPDEFESEDDKVLNNVKEQLLDSGEGNVTEDLNTILNKYPKIIEQTIGTKPIKLLFNGEWVKPTIGNWIADYRAYSGAGPHEMNERSDYLLRSTNSQNLAKEERECLGLLLRSYDEDYPLNLSVNMQKIIF